MNDTYFYSLERAVSVFFKNYSPYFVNIGANDGKKYDPIFEISLRGEWSGLLVEPLPDAITKLKQNYADHKGNIQIAEVAVTEHDGQVVMMRVDPHKESVVGEWASYIAEIKDHASPYNLSQRKDVAPHMVEITCECRTLQTIFKEFDITKVDLLQIDTEGYDYIILKQIDFEKTKPLIIHFEYGQLPIAERKATKEMLTKAGYVFVLTNIKDMLAIPKERLVELVTDDELHYYIRYMCDGGVRNKTDLVYALALLGQCVSCLTSSGALSSLQPLSQSCNYQDIQRDSGGIRKRNIVEYIEAIDTIKSLFISENVFMDFIENELPLFQIRTAS